MRSGDGIPAVEQGFHAVANTRSINAPARLGQATGCGFSAVFRHTGQVAADLRADGLLRRRPS